MKAESLAPLPSHAGVCARLEGGGGGDNAPYARGSSLCCKDQGLRCKCGLVEVPGLCQAAIAYELLVPLSPTEADIWSAGIPGEKGVRGI